MDAPAQLASGGTILIVDDMPANLEVVTNHLERQGYCAIVALSGDEGIERAEFVRPDLILLDVMMPGLDGFETCRRLKSSEQTKAIPVIFMTALTDTTDKLAGFAAGAVDYVTKPLNGAEVLARATLRSMRCAGNWPNKIPSCNKRSRYAPRRRRRFSARTPSSSNSRTWLRTTCRSPCERSRATCS
jgi:DNA-binding response OmpR family regulator